jgi:hypothetical protein
LVAAGTLLVNNSSGSGTGSGNVTVNPGATLGGTGTISGTVTNNGTLSPGTSIGTMTINGDLILGGTTYFELNKTGGTKDFITGVATANYGGTLVVSNLAGTLNIGDNFQIFSATSSSGNFSSIINQTGQGGIGFTFAPGTGILSVVAGTPTNPNITYSVSGSTLTLVWPPNHLGWILQSQTNALSVGIRTNPAFWFDWPGSAAVTSTNLPIGQVNPQVLFRLRSP